MYRSKNSILLAIVLFVAAGAGIYIYFSHKVANLRRAQDEGIAVTAAMPDNIRRLISKPAFEDAGPTYNALISRKAPKGISPAFKSYLVFTDAIPAGAAPTAAIYHPALNRALGRSSTGDRNTDGVILEHVSLKGIGYYEDDAGRKTQDANRLYCTYTYVRVSDAAVLHRDTVWGGMPSKELRGSGGSPVGTEVKEEDKIKAIRQTLELQ